MRKPAMTSFNNLHHLTTGLGSLARRCCAFLVAFSLTMATLGYPAGAAHAAIRNADMLVVHQNLQLRLGNLPIRLVGVAAPAAEAPAREQNKSKKTPGKTTEQDGMNALDWFFLALDILDILDTVGKISSGSSDESGEVPHHEKKSASPAMTIPNLFIRNPMPPNVTGIKA